MVGSISHSTTQLPRNVFFSTY